MNLITRLRGWLRRRRRKRALKKQKADLREFVYLDEVSVYSLIASRLGPIATEFTENETKSLQVEAGSSISGNAGIATGEVSSGASSTRTRGSQVVRKSIVQTTFKELYEQERDSLVLQPMHKSPTSPKIRSLNELMTATKTPAADGWIVDPEKLSRGQLLEMEVQLEAEPIFRVSAVVSALLEIAEEDPAIFGLDSHDQLVQVKSIERILEKLLVGLVPIRGYAVDYEAVELEQKEWIIHRTLLDGLPTTDLPPKRPLYVVGVAEQTLFWRDIRRVLFSESHFRVLCRMVQDGLQDSWIPVKLAPVLDSVVPGLGSKIDALGAGMLAPGKRTSRPNQRLEQRQQLMHDVLVSYAKLLAEHYGQSLSAQDISEVVSLSKQQINSLGSQQSRRKAFDEIAAFLLGRFDLEREPLVVAQYRAVALADAGLDFSGQLIPLAVSDSVLSDADPSVASSEDRFLDSEFVAIYW